LTGSGLITLSNGRMLQGHVDGAFLSGTGESSLHFRGALDQTISLPYAVGLPDNHLNLLISSDGSKVEQLNGKLLGQTVMK
jgi:hypothetical protein